MMNPLGKVYLYLPVKSVMLHEHRQDLLADLKSHISSLGLTGDIVEVSKKTKPSNFVSGSVLISDLNRLGDDLPQIIKFISASIDNSIRLILPSDLIDTGDPGEGPIMTKLFLILAGSLKERRSAKIRQGQWLRKKKFKDLGREPLPEFLLQKARDLIDSGRSCRQAALLLQQEGYQISKSTIHRVVKEGGVG